MPQMAPYNWLILFMLFNMIMLTYCCYNNFLKIPKFIKKFNLKKNSFSWKW